MGWNGGGGEDRRGKGIEGVRWEGEENGEEDGWVDKVEEEWRFGLGEGG